MFATAVLTVSLGLGTVVSGPQAVAAPATAPCQYVAADLPLPAGAYSATLVAGTADSRLLLGELSGWTVSGVIWQDGTILRSMPGVPDSRVYPTGINNDAVVVGHVQKNNTNVHAAFRLTGENTYTYLTTPAGHGSWARAVNDAGDIAGEIYSPSGGFPTPVVWEAGKPGYTTIPGQSLAIAISPDRKVLTREGLVYDLNTGTSLQLPLGSSYSMLDGNRIFGAGYSNGYEITEWTALGQQVGVYAGGRTPKGVNKQNTVFAGFGQEIDPVAGLWTNGGWAAVQADKLPQVSWEYADITDDGVLLGNYRTSSGLHAASWVCAP
ncbi:hypothetical protein ALI144C_36760 [Actinosynnema sp. ALI-1.44]|nr:hypothetical protein ALI144C_36760 [Actinosynnema sp. ALI-1.44]